MKTLSITRIPNNTSLTDNACYGQLAVRRLWNRCWQREHTVERANHMATNRQLGPLQWDENEQKLSELVFALRKVVRVLGRPNLQTCVILRTTWKTKQCLLQDGLLRLGGSRNRVWPEDVRWTWRGGETSVESAEVKQRNENENCGSRRAAAMKVTPHSARPLVSWACVSEGLLSSIKRIQHYYHKETCHLTLTRQEPSCLHLPHWNVQKPYLPSKFPLLADLYVSSRTWLMSVWNCKFRWSL